MPISVTSDLRVTKWSPELVVWVWDVFFSPASVHSLMTLGYTSSPANYLFWLVPASNTHILFCLCLQNPSCWSLQRMDYSRFTQTIKPKVHEQSFNFYSISHAIKGINSQLSVCLYLSVANSTTLFLSWLLGNVWSLSALLDPPLIAN